MYPLVRVELFFEHIIHERLQWLVISMIISTGNAVLTLALFK